MIEPYSSQVLTGLSGSTPVGVNASLLDLIKGKSVSFGQSDNPIAIFVIIKSNLCTYLKHVGLNSSNENNNVKIIRIDYFDEDDLLIRTDYINYSAGSIRIQPIDRVSIVKITIEETFNGKPPSNIRLSIRGCFGIPIASTNQPPMSTSPSTSTPSTTNDEKFISLARFSSRLGVCHQIHLMSNPNAAKKAILYLSGTTPINGSLLDYFQPLKTISYNEENPKFIAIFQPNVYSELKSIQMNQEENNVRTYQIDFFDLDRTVIDSVIIDIRNNQSIEKFPIGINGFQITYLTTVNGKFAKNIRLKIDGCFAIDPSVLIETTTKPTRPTLSLTTRKCRNSIDSFSNIRMTLC